MPWSGGTVPAAADGTGRRCRRPGKHQCKLAACRPVAGAADPITVPHLPWQLPLLAPVALVLVLVVLIFCLLARRGGYRRGFREERVVMRQMAREEQEAAVPPMPHRPARSSPPPRSLLRSRRRLPRPRLRRRKARPSGSRKAGIARPGNTGPRRPGLSGGEAGRAGHRSAVGGDQADVAHFFRKPNNPFSHRAGR